MTYHKYNVSPPRERTLDGIEFQSKAEMIRYAELKLLEKAKEITELTLQPIFLLQEGFKKNGKAIRAIEYIADFKYIENGEIVIEDVKGVRTAEYKIKKKLFEYKYRDLEIKEIFVGERSRTRRRQ